MRLGVTSIPPLLLLLIAPLLLAACGSASDGPNTITLYSGQHEQTTATLVEEFERQTGIKVQIRSADEATLGNQIVQEGSNSPADVFYSENTPVLEALQQKGLLAPVESSTLSAVPSRYSSTRGDWVGVSGRISALVYDTSALHPGEVPSALLELASKRLRGKVGFAPSETDFQPLVTAIIRLDGKAAAEHWLLGLLEGARVYPDNETLTAQVNNGESQLGPINSYYWFRLRREQGAAGTHSAVGYYAHTDPGNLLNVSGAAILRSSSHKAAAKKLLAFLVSAAGQQALAHSDSYEYPLRPGVAAAPELPPLSSLHPNGLTPAELGDGIEALEMEQRLGLL